MENNNIFPQNIHANNLVDVYNQTTRFQTTHIPIQPYINNDNESYKNIEHESNIIIKVLAICCVTPGD